MYAQSNINNNSTFVDVVSQLKKNIPTEDDLKILVLESELLQKMIASINLRLTPVMQITKAKTSDETNGIGFEDSLAIKFYFGNLSKNYSIITSSFNLRRNFHSVIVDEQDRREINYPIINRKFITYKHIYNEFGKELIVTRNAAGKMSFHQKDSKITFNRYPVDYLSVV